MLQIYRTQRRALTASEAAKRKEILSLFQKASKDIEADIFDVFHVLGQDNWDLASVRRIGRDKMLLDQVNNRIEALGGTLVGQLQDATLDQFKRTWAGSAYQLDQITPESVGVRFGMLPDQEILALLDQPFEGARFSDRLGLITDDMAHKIQQSLAYSMLSQDSWQDAARRIRDQMGTAGQGSVWRAEMIARTELARAQELANAELFSQNDDVIEKVIWVAHPTACDECKDMHGEEIEDTGDYPPLHPNCVCSALAIPKSWEELASTDEGDFSISPKSRAKWAQENKMQDLIG